MVFYITVLRALAACLITNAHYTGIYPTDIIANGGLIGDIIFFAVSGYCLYNIKQGFFKWYWKRLYRCYLPVILITLIYWAVGFYNVSDNPLWWLVYPTNYHFVASIIILYVPYYFVVKIDGLKSRIPTIALVILVAYLVLYVFFYIKSYYHIDNVYEPMIRFLFFESMLLGAWFRQNESKYINRINLKSVLHLILLFALYFASKLVFLKIASLSYLQILNQALIYLLLFMVLRVSCGISQKLENMNEKTKKIILCVSNITLEIYVVQYAIIDIVRPIFKFPINWIILTSSIITAAVALRFICEQFEHCIEKLTLKQKSDLL